MIYDTYHWISRKGRPVGTASFKGPLEALTKSNIIGSKTQNKCSLCNNMGYNRATCPSNPDLLIERKETLMAPFGHLNVLKKAKYHLVYLFVVII